MADASRRSGDGREPARHDVRSGRRSPSDGAAGGVDRRRRTLGSLIPPAAAAAWCAASPASTSRVILPSRTSEIVPSSSETTITTASVSSVRPIAARWRVPSVFETFGLVGERQEAARRRDAAVLDDERAVVDRRVGQEDAGDQLARHLRVEPGADVDVLVQPDLVLQHDQRADAAAGEVRHRLHQLLDRLALRHPVARRVERPGAHLRQHAADVVLEDDEEQHERPAEHVVQEDVDGVDLELRRQEVEAVHHRQADQHRHGARAADQVDAGVDADGEEEDVEAVLPAEADETRSLMRAPPPSPPRRTSRIARDVVHADERARRVPRPAPPRPPSRRPRAPMAAPPSSAPMKPLRDTPTSTG